MTDRSIAQEEKRRLLLAAAVRTFARKGYHTCRVADIAEEAGVAHGLIYHYFSSKEEVLETVFEETWRQLLGAVSAVEASEEPAREQLRHVAAVLLRSWRRDPDLVRVLVREVARSPQLERHLEAMDEVLRAVERIVERGQARGELRADVEPRLAALVLYGALEQILTAWVLGRLEDGDEGVARAERTVVEALCGGLACPVAAGAEGRV